MKSFLSINKYKTFVAIIVLFFFIKPVLSQEFIDKVKEGKRTILKGTFVKYNNAKATENKKEIAKYASQIAFIYKESGVSVEALRFLDEALEQNKLLGNSKAIEQISGYIGMLYADLERYSEALPYYRESLRLKKRTGTKRQIAAEKLNLAVVLGKLNKQAEAINILEEALAESMEENDKILIRSCYKYLSEYAKILGFPEKADEYYALFRSFDRHIQQSEIRKIKSEKLALEGKNAVVKYALQEEQLRLKISQENLDLAEQENRNAAMKIELLNNQKQINELEMQRQKEAQKVQQFIIYGLIVIFVLMVLFGFVVYRNYRIKIKTNRRLRKQYKEILEQRNEISSKNTELAGAFDKINNQNLNITNSINYARRIQTALIPTEAAINNYFEESFVLFKPRDIVSGDFYWLNEISNGSPDNKKIMVVSGDCTGHGVPGAIMSVIGINLLHEAAREKIIAPDLLLDKLNSGVQKTLKQDSTDNKDGMDMGVLVVDKKNNLVRFAGANNPVVYVKSGELFQIKGDKKPIGSYAKKGNVRFTEHTIPITEPTWFYLFSDGYADQFGGRSQRKYMIKNLRNLLKEISNRPAQEQKNILNLVIEAWIGDKKQIDDINIVGFKVYPSK